MNHGSLFSGIGGFDLAAEWMGWENIFQVEIDKFCTKVLEKNFPNVKRYGDIKEFDGTKYRGLIDILTGGFPCQPFSVAGKRKGKADDRHLWPEYLRVIREIKPSYVVGENVPGIIDMELDNIIADLEGEGYTTEQFIIPAVSVGARHRRDRLWIIAYTSINAVSRQNGESNQIKNRRTAINEQKIRGQFKTVQYDKLDAVSQFVTNTQSTGLQIPKIEESSQNKPRNRFECENTQFICKAGIWPAQSPLCGRNDGISNRVDRIKALGNAIVPQIAYEIFKAIEQYEKIL